VTAALSANAKGMLRRTVLEHRRSTHRTLAAHAAHAVKSHLLAAITPNDKTIAGYWPLGDELDCRPALEALYEAGAQIALPVVAGQGEILIFRAWRPGDPLEEGPFGTKHPSGRAAPMQPQILLVPLIAFDRTGQRLGYGAGYYDRTIAALRAHSTVTAIGLAYDVQEVSAVPTDAHDERLDAMITNAGTLWFTDPGARNV